jgi:hypothetical protein
VCGWVLKRIDSLDLGRVTCFDEGFSAFSRAFSKLSK